MQGVDIQTTQYNSLIGVKSWICTKYNLPILTMASIRTKAAVINLKMIAGDPLVATVATEGSRQSTGKCHLRQQHYWVPPHVTDSVYHCGRVFVHFVYHCGRVFVWLHFVYHCGRVFVHFVYHCGRVAECLYDYTLCRVYAWLHFVYHCTVAECLYDYTLCTTVAECLYDYTLCTTVAECMYDYTLCTTMAGVSMITLCVPLWQSVCMITLCVPLWQVFPWLHFV